MISSMVGLVGDISVPAVDSGGEFVDETGGKYVDGSGDNSVIDGNVGKSGIVGCGKYVTVGDAGKSVTAGGIGESVAIGNGGVRVTGGNGVGISGMTGVNGCTPFGMLTHGSIIGMLGGSGNVGFVGMQGTLGTVSLGRREKKHKGKAILEEVQGSLGVGNDGAGKSGNVGTTGRVGNDGFVGTPQDNPGLAEKSSNDGSKEGFRGKFKSPGPTGLLTVWIKGLNTAVGSEVNRFKSFLPTEMIKSRSMFLGNIFNKGGLHDNLVKNSVIWIDGMVHSCFGWVDNLDNKRITIDA